MAPLCKLHPRNFSQKLMTEWIGLAILYIGVIRFFSHRWPVIRKSFPYHHGNNHPIQCHRKVSHRRNVLIMLYRPKLQYNLSNPTPYQNSILLIMELWFSFLTSIPHTKFSRVPLLCRGSDTLRSRKVLMVWYKSTKIFQSNLKLCSSSKQTLSMLTKSCVR